MFLFVAAQEYPIFDQNRDSFDTERTRNGLQKIRNKLPLQKIKHFVLLCNCVCVCVCVCVNLTSSRDRLP